MDLINQIVTYLKYRNIKVSVILPVFNAEKYIGKCIDSILNQSLKDIEIIAVNDCSTDISLDILKKHSAKHPVLKIIDHKKNMGAGAARNNAIKKARGKYIAFIDSDDWLSDRYLELLYEEAENTASDIVFSNMKYVDRNTECENKDFYTLMKKYHGTEESLIDLASDWTYTAPWMKLYNKDFILKNKLKFLEGIKLGAEDIPFTWISYFTATKISFSEAACYYYNIIPESLDRSVNEVIFEIFDALNFTKREYQHIDPQHLRYNQLEAMYVSHIFYQFTKITSSGNIKLASEYWAKAHQCIDNFHPEDITQYNYLPERKKRFYLDIVKHQNFDSTMQNKYFPDDAG